MHQTNLEWIVNSTEFEWIISATEFSISNKAAAKDLVGTLDLSCCSGSHDSRSA